MKYLNVFLIVYSLLITNVFGATITDDTLKIGKPGSAGPVQIKSKDGGYLKKEVSGDWLFSNDGLLEKKLGSGSGSGGSGGIQLLENDSFEDGITPGWSNVGGTFSQQTYTNGYEGNLKYARFIATAPGEYFETPLKIIPTNVNGGCQADFKKVNIATSDLFKVDVLDSSGNVLATGNVKSSAWIKLPTLSFVCPISPATARLRVTSLAAGTIEADLGYLGSNQNIVNTIASYDYDPTPFSPTFGGAGFVSPVNPCRKSRKGGWLHVSCNYLQNGVGGSIWSFDLPDSLQIDASRIVATNGLGSAGQVVGAWKQEVATQFGSLVVNTGASLTKVYAAASVSQTPQLTPQVSNAIMGNSITDIYFKVPILGWSEIKQQDIAVSPEQSNWFIDVNIGGTNPTLPTTSSYAEITGTSLDMVINQGSAPAQIPCSGTNPSTGVTCAAGNESLGVVFTPNSNGRFRVCAYFSSNGGAGTGALQLVETPNNAQTILQEGNSRSAITFSSGTANYSSQSTCGYFNFSDISKKTIRLMGEVNSGPLSIYSDRNSSIGQPDVHFVVENVTFAQNKPFLTGDQVTTKGAANPRSFSFQVNLGSGVVSRKVGSGVTSCSNTSPGTASCTMPSDTFSSAASYNCQPVAAAVSSNCVSIISGYTSTGFQIQSATSQTGTINCGIETSVFCHGN